MPNEPCLIQAQLLTKPGAQLYQRSIGFFIELPALIGMADLDGNGIDIPAVGSDRLLAEGNALHDLPLQPHDEMGTDAGGGLIEIVAVGHCRRVGVADVMDRQIAHLFKRCSRPGVAVQIDKLLIHPSGAYNCIQIYPPPDDQRMDSHPD